jgi:L-malate glycosyltransferase
MSARNDPLVAVSTTVPSLSCEHALHIFPSFGIGGIPLRMVRLMNHFGKQFRHTVIALDNNFEAATSIAGDLDVRLLPLPYPKRGLLRAVAGGVQMLRSLKPDLLLTYNWGAIEWAMAGRLLRLRRHVHIEAGFGRDEANAQIPRRVLFRRCALGGPVLVVVPSRRLEELARGVWRLPRVVYVPNGVDTARFSSPVRDRVAGFVRRAGEMVIGTVAPLRPEKNIGRLLRVFAQLGDSLPVRLIIAGEGIERRSLGRLAFELNIADRILFTGQVAPEAVLGTFDIFALSSDTEQMPNALLEAMAAGRAVAAVDVGDVRKIVCEGNREFIVPRDDGQAFARAIMRLLSSPAMRVELGRQNRERVVSEYSQERMFADYSRIFTSPDSKGFG